MFNKLQLNSGSSVCIWIICVVLIYLLVVRNASEIDYLTYEADEISNVVEAIVFVSMAKMAQNNLVDFSIASVRKIGGWDKAIYVLTDRPECFHVAHETYHVNIITVPIMKSIVEIKSLKTELFNHIPTSVNAILYMDVDILVAKPLRAFLRDLSTQIIHRSKELSAISKNNKLRSVGILNTNISAVDIAMFPDAKGHYVGFCNGCEKWHTGVIWMKRSETPTSSTNMCLKEWKNVLLSGKYDTDQQSIDDTDNHHYCPYMITLLTKHLLFAKDYIGMILMDTPTFWHITGKIY